MVLIVFYLMMVWLLFSKLKLIPWGWVSGAVTVMVGALILAVFMALFNHLTPSGRIAVFGRVVEVTPNVAGQVGAILVLAASSRGPREA